MKPTDVLTAASARVTARQADALNMERNAYAAAVRDVVPASTDLSSGYGSNTPWVGATPEQEMAWYGTSVLIIPKPGAGVGTERWLGTLVRVLNRGDVLEVTRPGTPWGRLSAPTPSDTIRLSVRDYDVTPATDLVDDHAPAPAPTSRYTQDAPPGEDNFMLGPVAASIVKRVGVDFFGGAMVPVLQERFAHFDDLGLIRGKSGAVFREPDYRRGWPPPYNGVLPYVSWPSSRTSHAKATGEVVGHLIKDGILAKHGWSIQSAFDDPSVEPVDWSDDHVRALDAAYGTLNATVPARAEFLVDDLVGTTRLPTVSKAGVTWERNVYTLRDFLRMVNRQEDPRYRVFGNAMSRWDTPFYGFEWRYGAPLDILVPPRRYKAAIKFLLESIYPSTIAKVTHVGSTGLFDVALRDRKRGDPRDDRAPRKILPEQAVFALTRNAGTVVNPSDVLVPFSLISPVIGGDKQPRYIRVVDTRASSEAMLEWSRVRGVAKDLGGIRARVVPSLSYDHVGRAEAIVYFLRADGTDGGYLTVRGRQVTLHPRKDTSREDVLGVINAIYDNGGHHYEVRIAGDD